MRLFSLILLRTKGFRAAAFAILRLSGERLADADETYENEDALAPCLRGSLGIGQGVELDEAGDVQYSQEQADEKRFALRKSPQAGEFGGLGIHARVTVHAGDKDGRERLLR